MTNTLSVAFTVRVVVVLEFGYTAKLPSDFLYCHWLMEVFVRFAVNTIEDAEVNGKASVFGYWVSDPERYGVA